ncbi:MAG: transporter substrate-binding domain-containing protein [Acidobacteriota bacterium]
MRLKFSAPLVIALALFSLNSRADSASTLKVCARPNPGFLERTPSGVAGLEYDVLSSFAEREGVGLEIRWLPSFSELIPSVEKGGCDVGSAGVMVTEERSRRVAFSEPYFPVRVMLVGSPSSDRGSLDSLEGSRVAVVGGTVHEAYAESHEASEIVTVSEDADLFASVVDGRADLAICDSAIVLPFLEQYPELQILDSLSERSFFAFALPRASSWQEPLTAHIQKLKSSKSYRKFLVRHFGETAAAYVLDEDE